MYGTPGIVTAGLPAASAALATPSFGTALGASGLVPRTLPASGGGGMALAASGHAPALLAMAVLLLALWTLLMAGRVLCSMWPKAEV
jgi:hypothetical protein